MEGGQAGGVTSDKCCKKVPAGDEGTPGGAGSPEAKALGWARRRSAGQSCGGQTLKGPRELLQGLGVCGKPSLAPEQSA